MELINKEYVKIDKSDLFIEQVRASSYGDKFNLSFFQNLTRLIYDYEKGSHITIDELYIKTDCLWYKERTKTKHMPIFRQTIINAIIYAMNNNETDIALQLKKFTIDNKTFPSELENLLDYVLINGMDTHEYYNGERKKFIYNDIKNEIETGKIYSTNNANEHKLLKKIRRF